MISSTKTNGLALAFQDARDGVAAWRIWWLLAKNDVGRRYRRSRIGQFWITISMVLLIGALGTVYSTLFNMSLGDYLPYLCVSFVMWTFIATTLNESTTVFPEAENYMRQLPLPLTTYLFRLITRNLMVFAHNAVIIVLVFLWFAQPISFATALFIPGLILAIVAVACMAGLLALICTRFRDIPQIVASVMQIAFFVTPIMFKPAQLPEHVAWILKINPFASLLALVRDPLLGVAPDLHDWTYAGGIVIVGGLILMFAFGRFRNRIVYWL